MGQSSDSNSCKGVCINGGQCETSFHSEISALEFPKWNDSWTDEVNADMKRGTLT